MFQAAITGRGSSSFSGVFLQTIKTYSFYQGGRLATHVRAFYIADRVMGAFFSILFFLAISGTVVR